MVFTVSFVSGLGSTSMPCFSQSISSFVLSSEISALMHAKFQMIIFASSSGLGVGIFQLILIRLVSATIAVLTAVTADSPGGISKTATNLSCESAIARMLVRSQNMEVTATFFSVASLFAISFLGVDIVVIQKYIQVNDYFCITTFILWLKQDDQRRPRIKLALREYPLG
jgi:hypothetical protein